MTTTIFRRLWEDDQGAVLSVELILLLGILIFGLIPGLVALRNGINAASGTITNTIQGITPSFTYSGYLIGGEGLPPFLVPGPSIAQVGGYSLTPNTTLFLSASQVTPVPVTAFVLSPAP